MPADDQFADDTYPCPGDFILGYDVSNDLSNDNYKKQVNFLLKQVFNNQWKKVDRLALISYASFSSVEVYGTFNVLQEVVEYIQNDVQRQHASYLRRVFDSIVNSNLVHRNHSSHAIIFVATVDRKAVDDCRVNVKKIQAAGCELTFVAMGKGVDFELLKELSPRIIQWNIDNESTPDDWETKFWTAYGCSDHPPTKAPPSSTTTQRSPKTLSPTAATSSPNLYVPCNSAEGREVVLLFDNGNDLNSNEYKTVVSFLQNKVFNYWTHFERLVLGYYNLYSSKYEPGFFLSLFDVHDFLDNIPQSHHSANVRRLFTFLTDDRVTRVSNFPQYYIVFVTRIDQESINIIKPIVDNELGAAKVTFVALKNADQALLRSLVPDVIDWLNMSKSTPDNWETQFWKAYGCNDVLPTVSPSSTQLTKQFNTPATTLTSSAEPIRPSPPSHQSTTEHAPVPFYPCRKRIIIILDSSSSLTANSYAAEKDLVENRILSNFTHMERLSLGYYAKTYSVEQPSFCEDIDCVRNYITSVQQSISAPNARRVLQFLSQDSLLSSDMKQVFVLLVGRMTDDDVADCQPYADQIRSFARLIMVGLQNSVLKSNLDQLADFSHILDLSQPIPSDFEDVLARAYGC